MRKTDEQIIEEYCKEMNCNLNFAILVPFVKAIRKQEPRINSGWHLVCYCHLTSEHDTMDSVYGSDFFEENP